MPRGDDDAGDELGRPGSWPHPEGFPSNPYEWPYPGAHIVHGDEAQAAYEHEVGKAAPAGPQTVKIAHEPKHAKNPPWLTWGNTVVQQVTGAPLVPSFGPLAQLVNVRYGRPETWRFLLAAKLLGTQSGNLPPVAVSVQFQVTIGNGWTSFTQDFFQTLEFELGAQFGDSRICTEVQLHPANTFFAGSNPAPNVVQWLPAQDLYIAANIATEGSINAGEVLTMSMTAMVAPNVHVRPGWHLDIFAGGEEKF